MDGVQPAGRTAPVDRAWMKPERDELRSSHDAVLEGREPRHGTIEVTRLRSTTHPVAFLNRSVHGPHFGRAWVTPPSRA
jgi:hypothetical protein